MIFNILKNINSKQMFEYVKIQQKKLKNLKFEFQQVEQELQDLLEGGSEIDDQNSVKKNIHKNISI